MLIVFLIVVAIGIYVYKYQRKKIEAIASKVRYGKEDSNYDKIFFSQKLNDEFVNNQFLDSTITQINQNGIDYLEIYPDRMEFKDKVVNYSNIGMNTLDNVGECRALACYIQSNLYNKYKYEVSKISDFYQDKYNANAIGYSLTDRSKKFNL